METKKEEEKEKLRGKKGNTKNSNLKMILDCCFSCSTLLFSLLLQLLFHLPPPFPSLALSDLLLFRTLPHHFICLLLHFFPHATTMRVFSNHYFIPPIPESQLHHTAARVSAPFPFFALCIHLFLYSVLCCPPFPVVQSLSLSLHRFAHPSTLPHPLLSLKQQPQPKLQPSSSQQQQQQRFCWCCCLSLLLMFFCCCCCLAL